MAKRSSTPVLSLGAVSRNPARTWFEAGKEAFENVTGMTAEGYVCPLCLRDCTVEEVTREDVPPRAIRGRKICLTCNECNHASGHTLDDELARTYTYRDWSRGTLGRPLRARSEIRGVPLIVDVEWTPDRITVIGAEHNDPAHRAAQTAVFEHLAATREPDWGPFTLSLPDVDARRAQIALLRAAYLVAFTAFGYRYALRSSLDVVRQQIANSDDELIERFSLHFKEARKVRGLAWMERPRSLESVVVQIDVHVIFLPGLKPVQATGIYERLAARTYWPFRRQTARHMRWHDFAWPTRPRHAFDGDPTP
jgi:hypothetical protein